MLCASCKNASNYSPETAENTRAFHYIPSDLNIRKHYDLPIPLHSLSSVFLTLRGEWRDGMYGDDTWFILSLPSILDIGCRFLCDGYDGFLNCFRVFVES